MGRRVMLLGLDHLVHALAETGEACVLTAHGDASHLSRNILVGADAALPSVADGGGAVQTCVAFLAREAVGAGLEGRVTFVAGSDADAVVGGYCAGKSRFIYFGSLVRRIASKVDEADELCRN